MHSEARHHNSLAKQFANHTQTIPLLIPFDVVMTSSSDESNRKNTGMANGWFLAALLTGHSGAVRSVSFTPDGHMISGSNDRTVRLWCKNISTGTWKDKIIIRNCSDLVRRVGCLPDGGIIFWLDCNFVCVLHANPTTGEWERDLELHGRPHWVEMTTITSDGSILIRLWDDMVHLWRKNSTTNAWEDTIVFNKQFAEIISVSSLPDGSLVFALETGIVRIWQKNRAEDKWEAGPVLTKHFKTIPSLAALPNGEIVSHSFERSLCIWQKDHNSHEWEEKKLQILIIGGVLWLRQYQRMSLFLEGVMTELYTFGVGNVRPVNGGRKLHSRDIPTVHCHSLPCLMGVLSQVRWIPQFVFGRMPSFPALSHLYFF